MLRRTENAWQECLQPLGRTKNAENCASNPLEEWKTQSGAFPTPWKIKKRGKLRFQPLGRTRNAAGCVSNPLERFF